MTSPDPTAVALSLQVAELRQKLAEMELDVHALKAADAKKVKPRESIAWHDITDEERELQVARLRGWERDVLIPVLGKTMPTCWPLHTPALVRMEVMCELWRVLWLSKRTAGVLASQAEFLIRQLGSLAEDIRSICNACEHQKPAAPPKAVAS